jgi:hypothetical protein
LKKKKQFPTNDALVIRAKKTTFTLQEAVLITLNMTTLLQFFASACVHLVDYCCEFSTPGPQIKINIKNTFDRLLEASTISNSTKSEATSNHSSSGAFLSINKAHIK